MMYERPHRINENRGLRFVDVVTIEKNAMKHTLLYQPTV